MNHFTETEHVVLERLDRKFRRREMERVAMPSPSGRPTLLLPAEALHVPPEPPTVRDLGGPLVQD